MPSPDVRLQSVGLKFFSKTYYMYGQTCRKPGNKPGFKTKDYLSTLLQVQVHECGRKENHKDLLYMYICCIHNSYNKVCHARDKD